MSESLYFWIASASALVTLSFDPSDVILDTTSDIMKNATYTTSLYNGINYIVKASKIEKIKGLHLQPLCC